MKIYRNLPCPILSYSFWSRIFPPLFWSSHVGANSAGTSAVFYLPDMECLASFDGVHSRVMSSNCFSWKIIRYSTFSAETKQGTGHPKFSLLLSNKSGCRAIRTADKPDPCYIRSSLRLIRGAGRLSGAIPVAAVRKGHSAVRQFQRNDITRGGTVLRILRPCL